MNIVAIVSGGMDSVTLAHHLADAGRLSHVVSFDYGQRHARELTFAALCAQRLDARHSIIAMPDLADLLSTSALTGDGEVPEGHYAEETMRATVVPNRNMIMLSIAAGVAIAEAADGVAYAAHAGDHFVYPDCRPEFARALERALELGNVGFAVGSFHLATPFINITKAGIVDIGERLGVPWAETWSCYVGGEVHCGRCGTCVERAEAFALAQVDDPTTYADPSFWREAVKA